MRFIPAILFLIDSNVRFFQVQIIKETYSLTIVLCHHEIRAIYRATAALNRTDSLST